MLAAASRPSREASGARDGGALAACVHACLPARGSALWRPRVHARARARLGSRGSVCVSQCVCARSEAEARRCLIMMTPPAYSRMAAARAPSESLQRERERGAGQEQGSAG